MHRLKLSACLCLFLVAPVLRPAAALSPDQVAQLPPPAGRTIEFRKDVQPILEAACLKCHGRGKDKGGFSLEDRQAMLKGGDSGPAVLPGKSAESHFIELVSGLNPDNIMPQKGSRLKPDQVSILRAWIDQGAAWDADVRFGRTPPVNLQPRKPELPAAGSLAHPIDRLLQPYFAAHGVAPGAPVSDRAFARRVYLDVIGLLPAPGELAEFESDTRPDKRERLVKRLLADDRHYAEHWLTFWNDLLRNDYKGTGYIDGGREQITPWLYAALASNEPFDEFVNELVNPGADSAGFAKGIVWRGVINASQTPQMQAAQNISQVFLGVNLKCASCHDSFINDWTLADAYGLASVYSDDPLELVQCDKPTGKIAETRFIYPELGAIDGKAPKAERLKQLATLLTSDRNGRLSRTIVNRLWGRFFGRALVEPVDDMEQPAWHPDLLDWLAADLVEGGYDLKRTMERILTSQAYQLAAVPAGEQSAKDQVFRGPIVRRLSAEQYLDALSGVTGVWNDLPAAQVNFNLGVEPPTPLDGAVDARWIWKDREATEKTAATTIYLRREFNLSEVPNRAAVVASGDNRFTLFLNGKELFSASDYTKPKLADLRPHLVKGRNVFAVQATNDRANPDQKEADQSNPAGFILHAFMRHESLRDGVRVEKVMDLASDRFWVWTETKMDGWQQPDFAATDWLPAAELGDPAISPWSLTRKWNAAVASAGRVGRVRAALVNSNPLMTALGRPNREQVITTRLSTATTLQALEMTNGSTLAALLKKGAEELARGRDAEGGRLVTMVFERAIGRKPTDAELQLAQGLVGTPVRPEGVEDLLWAVTQLPEFQLIF